jgi:ABC-type antimicrobial peptide transport system permease subunit
VIAGLAFRNVLRNKERSLLTLVGVVLAIGSFVALVSLAAGFTRRVERELQSREVHIYVTASRGSNLPASPLSGGGGSAQLLPIELEETLAIEGVLSITPIIRTALDTERSVIPVIAMPLKDAKIVFRDAQFNLENMGDSLANTPFQAPGQPTPRASATPRSPQPSATPPSKAPSTGSKSEKLPPALIIVGRGLNKEIEKSMTEGALVVEQIPFQVGGSMSSDGFLDFMILAPLERFLQQRDNRGVHEYWITLDDVGRSKQIKATLQERVNAFLEGKKTAGDYAGARKIRVMDQEEYLESARDYLGYGWLLQFAVSMVGVLIAITASMNTMLMSTYERLGEYATLRAVGASRRVIGMTIVYEAIFLNVTGGFLGLVFGYLATGVLDKAVAILLEIPYPMAGVTPGLLLQALGLSFVVGLIGAVIPIFIVSRIDLVAQLRKGM